MPAYDPVAIAVMGFGICLAAALAFGLWRNAASRRTSPSGKKSQPTPSTAGGQVSASSARANARHPRVSYSGWMFDGCQNEKPRL